MDDELVSDSDDKRKLFKAIREAQQTVKRKRAESSAAVVAKKRAIPSGELQPQDGTSQRFSQGFWLVMVRPQMVGPVTGVASWGIWWPAVPSRDNSILLSSLW